MNTYSQGGLFSDHDFVHKIKSQYVSLYSKDIKQFQTNLENHYDFLKGMSDISFEVYHKLQELFFNITNSSADDSLVCNNLLDIWSIFYHTLDHSIVEDDVYDDIYNLYLSISKQDDDIQVGSQVLSVFEKVKHKIPMLSLDKAHSDEDAISFDERVKNYLNLALSENLSYCVEPKIDGLSLSIIYKNGIFEKAVTRGDGEFGEDVSQQVRVIKSIPAKLIGDFPEILEVRGEVFIFKNDFLTINAQQLEKGEKQFANPRNLAAGSLRTLDSNITQSRNLQFIAYAFGDISEDFLTDSFYENVKKLKALGFIINEHNKLCNCIKESIKYYNQLTAIRYSLDYDIDGVVYKVDSITLQNRLGNLLTKPRWALAHKFSPQEALTVIEDIVIQVGRTGVLTPVANLKPVNIGGVVVSRASLHNIEEVQRKDARVGDSVLVKRAGDIIPQITKVILNKRLTESVEFTMPEFCPVCGSKVEKKEGQVATVCTGGKFFCKAMILESLKHFVSKAAFDIDRLGEKQIELFYSLGYIKQPSDIWNLKYHKEEIITKDGYGEKSVHKLLQAIEDKSSIALDRFIYSLGIPQIGEKNSQILAHNFKNVINLISHFYNKEEVDISGLGSNMIDDLYSYFTNESNLEIINNLLNVINVKEYQDLKLKSGIFFGKNVLFTGTLSSLSRAEAKNLAQKNGANIVSAVSSKLDYLVVGEKPGSKEKKALELGITIITEAEFKNLIS